ncbi:MAG: hypothetical protein AUH85_13605 [Chloroflexi bacterium 13_1_40CM_4_68_4]|nr:MAG: hypothetical protein AUH85_13605 [Chloroflexi bacterium 13_1_40CM_4_68_4]
MDHDGMAVRDAIRSKRKKAASATATSHPTPVVSCENPVSLVKTSRAVARTTSARRSMMATRC